MHQLGLCTFTTKDPGSVLAWGTKIPQVQKHGPKKRKKIWDIATAVYRGQHIALFTLTRKVATQ